jgi:hypothetical protein
LLGEPLLVAGFDEFGERRERSFLGIDGVADEGDQVREGFDGVGGEGALCEVFVGFPDLSGCDVVGQPGDGFGESFELFVNEVPFGVRAVEEDLEGGDFVLIVQVCSIPKRSIIEAAPVGGFPEIFVELAEEGWGGGVGHGWGKS